MENIIMAKNTGIKFNMMRSNSQRLKDLYNCYTQTANWADGSILPKHERESPTGYSRRKSMFCSPSIYPYLINTFDVITAKAPVRTGHDDLYEQFIYDAGNGQSLTDFIKRALKLSMVLGSVFVIIDSPEEQASDIESMVKDRAWPFAEIILPQDVTRLIVDRVGRIQLFTYTYYDTDHEMNIVKNYREYSPGMVRTHDVDDNTLSVVVLPNNIMPVIPIVPSMIPLVTSEVPASQTLGLYQQQYNIVTTNSLIDEAMYAQQFSVLVVTGKDDIKNITLGTSNTLKLSEGATANFISPSGTPIDLMMKRIEQNIIIMQKTFANLLTSGDAQSGLAKVIDRQVGSMQLKDIAGYMEKVEYKIYETFCGFTNSYNPEYLVNYYKDFDLGDVATYIAQASEMLGINFSDEVKQQVKEDLLRKFFSGTDPDELTALIISERGNVEAPVSSVDQLQVEETDSEQESVIV